MAAIVGRLTSPQTDNFEEELESGKLKYPFQHEPGVFGLSSAVKNSQSYVVGLENPYKIDGKENPKYSGGVVGQEEPDWPFVYDESKDLWVNKESGE